MKIPRSSSTAGDPGQAEGAGPVRGFPRGFGRVAMALGVWLAAAVAILVFFDLRTGHPSARGLIAGAVSAALMTGFAGWVLWRPAARQPALPPDPAATPALLGPIPLPTKLALGGLLGMVLLVGYGLGWSLVEETLRTRLIDVATIQRSYLHAWIQAERYELQSRASRPLFGPGVTLQADRSTPPEVLLQQVRALHTLVNEGDYEAVTLRDPATGKRWISSDLQADQPSDIAEAQALVSNPPTHERTRLARPDPSTAPQQALKIFQLMTATADGQQAVVQINVPLENFFLRHMGLPMDPLPDAVSTLLVQRMGKGVVIFNDAVVRGQAPTPRYIDQAPPDSLWTALHLQGNQGFAQGRNADGEPILAYAVAVDQTNWTLVTQIDESRAHGRLNVFFLIALLIAGSLLWLALSWWRNVKYQSLESNRLAAERAAQAEQLADLSHRVVSAQEAERHHLAMELHDHIGADLSAIGLNLKFIERSVGSSPAQAAELLHETHGLLAETVQTVRDFCTQLRPSVLGYAGLEAALRTCTEQLQRRSGIQVDFTVVGPMRQRPPATELALFRIVQEALLNCERHAMARKLHLTWREDDAGLRVDIEDDGRGFDLEALGKAGQAVGHGVLNMRDRALLLGGKLHIRSHPGEGTCIYIHVPHR